ncbi:MAG: hypothetical protein R3B82_21905 [Sandaracinaceae bacterium]
MTHTSVTEPLRERFATADGPEPWARARKALFTAIRRAPDAATVRAIAITEGVDEAFLGEADGGDALTTTLIDRAQAEPDDAGAAEIAGWALRACAFDPCAFLTPERGTPKPDAVQGVRRRAKKLAGWMSGSSPERRAAAALAASWGVTPRAALIDRASDADPMARASFLLALSARAPEASAKEGLYGDRPTLERASP